VIAGEARNYMKVKVENALAGDSAAIHPEIESRRIKLAVEHFLDLVNDIVEGGHFFAGEVKEIAGMAFGNDESMPRRDGEVVVDGKEVVVFQ